MSNTEKPCFESFKERAEDLAFERPEKVNSLVNDLVRDIGQSDVSYIAIDILAKIIHDQTDVARTAIRYEILRVRMAHEKGDDEGPAPTTLLTFLNDEGACRLGDQKTHVTPRPVFFDAYFSWCARKGYNPSGKHKFYREIDHEAVLALGVRHGAGSKGHNVIRGVRLAEDDDEL